MTKIDFKWTKNRTKRTIQTGKLFSISSIEIPILSLGLGLGLGRVPQK